LNQFNNQYNQPNHKLEHQVTAQQEELLSQAQLILELSQHKGFQLLQNYLVNLTQQFPNPADYSSNEALMLAYTKSYGKAELVRQFNQFINEQRAYIERTTANIAQQEAEY
jgi:hypothetical protein